MGFTQFEGAMTALVTPLKNGQVDDKALAQLVEQQIAGGIDALVAVGTTGESATLNFDEHIHVVAHVVKCARERVPVIAGAGSNATDEAIALTRHAKSVGAEAVLHVTGYYNKPSQEGLYRHFMAIADAVDLPILLYNIPPRAIVDISVETMARLAKHPNIIGVKDATANLMRPTRERNACGKSWRLISGEDGTALGYMAHGGHGCISVTANVAPKLCAEFQDACLRGAYDRARELQDKLMPLHDAMFCEPSPAPVKYGVSLLGHCTPEVRLPLVELTDAGRARVREAMQGCGIKV
jgi:4-hydroxy-tetrahydrodipicolinate synthase